MQELPLNLLLNEPKNAFNPEVPGKSKKQKHKLSKYYCQAYSESGFMFDLHELSQLVLPSKNKR